jgi:hypothetical protein
MRELDPPSCHRPAIFPPSTTHLDEDSTQTGCLHSTTSSSIHQQHWLSTMAKGKKIKIGYTDETTSGIKTEEVDKVTSGIKAEPNDEDEAAADGDRDEEELDRKRKTKDDSGKKKAEKVTVSKNEQGDSFFALAPQRRLTVREFKGSVLIDFREVSQYVVCLLACLLLLYATVSVTNICYNDLIDGCIADFDVDDVVVVTTVLSEGDRGVAW